MNAYNDKKYADAAAAFEKVVAAEPYNRDALSNLSNTYLAMKNGPKLAGHRAASWWRSSRSARTRSSSRAKGYKQSAKVDDAVKTAEQVLALPADVKARTSPPTGSGATLTLTATGRAAQTAGGKPIPPAAMPDHGRVPRRHRRRRGVPRRRRSRRSPPARRRT